MDEQKKMGVQNRNNYKDREEYNGEKNKRRSGKLNPRKQGNKK